MVHQQDPQALAGPGRGRLSLVAGGRPGSAGAVSPARTAAWAWASVSSSARDFSSVSRSSASGSHSNSRVAPARTAATPSRMWAVRRVRPVFMLPSKPITPTAPPYQQRGASSWSSMNCMAQVLGAPVTVTAHMCDKNASSASSPGRSRPSMWSTVWIRRLYISIWRRPITLTLPGTDTRDLSLRSTSVHMVSSDSSLAELSRVRMFSASPRGSAPRRIVPEIGHVSTRSPLTRTYISGEAPTRLSPSPRLKKNSYGAGFTCRRVS